MEAGPWNSDSAWIQNLVFVFRECEDDEATKGTQGQTDRQKR